MGVMNSVALWSQNTSCNTTCKWDEVCNTILWVSVTHQNCRCNEFCGTLARMSPVTPTCPLNDLCDAILGWDFFRNTVTHVGWYL